MTDREIHTFDSGNGSSAGAQHQQMEARSSRESSIQTWYASAAAKRAGLETGARGWRWMAPMTNNPEQRR